MSHQRVPGRFVSERERSLQYILHQALRNVPDAWSPATCLELMTLAYQYVVMDRHSLAWTPPGPPQTLSDADLHAMFAQVRWAWRAKLLPPALVQRLEQMFTYVYARNAWKDMALTDAREAAATLQSMGYYTTIIVD